MFTGSESATAAGHTRTRTQPRVFLRIAGKYTTSLIIQVNDPQTGTRIPVSGPQTQETHGGNPTWREREDLITRNQSLTAEVIPAGTKEAMIQTRFGRSRVRRAETNQNGQDEKNNCSAEQPISFRPRC